MWPHADADKSLGPLVDGGNVLQLPIDLFGVLQPCAGCCEVRGDGGDRFSVKEEAGIKDEGKDDQGNAPPFVLDS